MLISARTRTNLLNLILFQAGWFVCVLGAAAGHPWLATLGGLLLVAAHLALVRQRGFEALLLLAALALGLVLDALHIATGVLRFPIGSLHPALPPPWILVLWLQFATTLHYSLSWLGGRPLLASLMGAVSGPLAYWAGVRFGAAELGPNLWPCLLQIGLGWAVAMPVLQRMAAWTGSMDPALYRLFAGQK